MLRNAVIALAVFAFAGTAAADCSDSHGARNTITDDQAQATQAPVKKASLPGPAKKTAAACEGSCADKTVQARKRAASAVALAPATGQPAEKPAN